MVTGRAGNHKATERDTLANHDKHTVNAVNEITRRDVKATVFKTARNADEFGAARVPTGRRSRGRRTRSM